MRRFFARLNLLFANFRIRFAAWVEVHSTRAWLVVAAILVLLTAALAPTFQRTLEPSLSAEQIDALRSIFVGVGGSLVAATAITFSVVMLAVQLNFARIPFGLFRRLSSDAALLSNFAATFLLGIAVAACALLPDVTWAGYAIVVSSWCTVAALGLFLLAYSRALALISPTEQLELVVGKAQNSMRWWSKLARRSAPLIQEKSSSSENRDLALAAFYRLHPEWERDIREGTNHLVAFARNYAEQGEYDVSAAALTGLVRINAGYIAARGTTFFPSNPLFSNPISAEGFISDTFERLRRLAAAAQARSDEEQFTQILATFARLCEVYASIDYGREHGVELQHSQLAASYLTRAIEGATRTFGPDVLMEGVRLASRTGLIVLQRRRSLGVVSIAESISRIAVVGLVKSDYEPVTSVAVKELATIAFELLRSAERDVAFASGELHKTVGMLARAALTTKDGTVNSRHSWNLKYYYSLTEHDTFGQKLGGLVNAVVDRPADDDDAIRILRHLMDWSDGL